MIYAVTPITNKAIEGLVGKTPEDAPSLLAKLISGVIGGFLLVATLWSFFQLLIGGLNWISSGGDKTKLESARQRIVNALIGLTVVFAAWAIFLLVLQFFGLSLIGKGGEFGLELPTLL